MNENEGDRVRRVFDDWAKSGKSEQMEQGHRAPVVDFLRSKLQKQYGCNNVSFLDVGCGNGWVVREFLNICPSCTRAVGIDKSAEMIKKAKQKKVDSREEYYCTDIFELEVSPGEKFDYVFSMEFLYYCVPMEPALKRIWSFLLDGKELGEKDHQARGIFFCGTDYYLENKESHGWPSNLGVKMDLRSKNEWKNMFESCGFGNVSMFQVSDQNSKEDWKRKLGTLFIVGQKQA